MDKAILEFHDVSPLFETELRKALSFAKKFTIERLSLLVVPDFWGLCKLTDCPEFVNLLSEIRQEIVLHGYNHLGRAKLWQFLFTDGEGEFAMSDRDDTIKRVKKGKEMFDLLGISSKYFVPPSWIKNSYLEDILRLFDFRIVSYRWTIKDLSNGKVIFSPSVTLSNREYVSYWSAVFVPYFFAVFCRFAECVRLAIHLSDFRDEKKIGIWELMVGKIKNKRRFITYGELFG
ncbi:MAG: polysaccharide deacetylase family protein [Deltaproteobacteria bacterium]|nr:polysaccharide deacetylase family protein [Deltaproteobacteria bacterium]